MVAVDQVRRTANSLLHPKRKIELGQFMTPASVAKFMAALFSERRGHVRLLDAGAGIGSLTAAFIDRWGSDRVNVTAYEIDESLSSFLRDILSCYGNCDFERTIFNRDFIQDAVYSIKLGKKGEGFTHAILNPPYKKINSKSAHRALLRTVGLETVNLYTAFVGLTIELMGQGGEVIAITPGASAMDSTTDRSGSGYLLVLRSTTSTCFTVGRAHSTKTPSSRRTSSSSSCAARNRGRSQ